MGKEGALKAGEQLVEPVKLIKMFSVFFVLTVYYFACEYNRTPPTPRRAVRSVFEVNKQPVEPGKIIKVVLPNVTLEKDKEGVWKIGNDGKALANQEMMTKIVHRLADAKTTGTFAARDELAEFGLGEDAPEIEVVVSGETPFYLVLGKSAKTGSCYARLKSEGDDNECMEINSRFLSLKDMGVKDFRFKKIFSMRMDDVSRISVSNLRTGARVVLDKKKEDWFLEDPIRDRSVDPFSAVSPLKIRDLFSRTINDSPETKPIGKPLFKISVEKGREKEMVEIWKGTKGKESYVARSSVQGDYFSLDDIAMPVLDIEKLRNNALKVPLPAKVKRIEINFPGKEKQVLVLKSGEGGVGSEYQMIKPFEGKSDYYHFSKICTALSRLRGSSFYKGNLASVKGVITYKITTISGEVYTYYLKKGEGVSNIQEVGRDPMDVDNNENVGELLKSGLRGEVALWTGITRISQIAEIELTRKRTTMAFSENISLVWNGRSWQMEDKNAKWKYEGNKREIEALAEVLLSMKAIDPIPRSELSALADFNVAGTVKIIPDLNSGNLSEEDKKEYSGSGKVLTYGSLVAKDSNTTLPFIYYGRWSRSGISGSKDVFAISPLAFRTLKRVDYRSFTPFQGKAGDVEFLEFELNGKKKIRTRLDKNNLVIGRKNIDPTSWKRMVEALAEIRVSRFKTLPEEMEADLTIWVNEKQEFEFWLKGQKEATVRVGKVSFRGVVTDVSKVNEIMEIIKQLEDAAK